jgi:hypothetical protein
MCRQVPPGGERVRAAPADRRDPRGYYKLLGVEPSASKEEIQVERDEPQS